MSLRVAEDFDLPLAVVGQKLAIFGMSGAGKSNAAARLCEQMHHHGAPWVVIDPKGDWYGVRSRGSGGAPGLNVPVLGGEFGDMPLSPDNGKRLGELVAAGQFRGVLDVSDFESDSDRSRFVADFGRSLLRNARTPVHVFCDECQDYMPQPGAGGRLDGPAAQCVNAWKQVALKGRNKGIGFTLCSQRIALVNKTCLYQCETLIAMRVQGARDKAAIKDHVSDLGDATELIRSLSTLEDGEAWVWSPQRLKITRRVKFLLRETFDSGRTPEVGESLRAPTLAPVDIAALREMMGTSEEENEEPKTRTPSKELAAENHRLKLDLAAALERENMLRIKLDAIRKAVDAVEPAPADDINGVPVVDLVTEAAIVPSRGGQPLRFEPKPAKPFSSARIDGLGKGEAKVLAALSQHGNGCTRSHLTILTGYKRSSRDAYLQRLKASGLVEQEGDRCFATTAGKKAASDVEPLPTGRELLQHYIATLPAGEARMLDVLSSRKTGFSRDELSERTGYKRSSRDAYLQRLGVRELVTAPPGGLVELSKALRGWP